MALLVLRLLSLRVGILSLPCGGGAPCHTVVHLSARFCRLKLNVHLLVSLSRTRDKSLHEKALEAIRDAKWDSMFHCVCFFFAVWVVKLQK